MNKKIIGLVTGIVVIIAIILVCVLSTGTQGTVENKAIHGKWVLIKVETMGTEMVGEDLDINFDGDVIYEFKEDGTANLTANNRNYTGTWKEVKDNVVMEVNDLSIKFEINEEEDILTSEQNSALFTIARYIEDGQEVVEETIAEEEITEE